MGKPWFVMVKNIFLGLSWAYAALVVLWFLLRACYGDTVWWLGLLNAFIPFFFLPLVLLVPVCFVYRHPGFWLSVSVPVVMFLLLYGRLFLPHTPVPDGTPITVMTFNIWGGSRMSATARVIVENGLPDIVALQELTPQMAEVLLEEVGDLYPYRLLEPEGTYRGMGVLSRFPLIGMDTRHLAHPRWQIQAMRVEAPAGMFTLYNVHPDATNVLVYIEEGMDIPAEVRDSLAMQRQFVETLIVDFFRRDEPVVVVGDFNSTDQSDVYALMRQHLTDTYRASGWGFGHTFPTYAGSFRGIPICPLQMRLDMVFVSKDFRAARAWVGRTYGESDHRPVLAELVWLKSHPDEVRRQRYIYPLGRPGTLREIVQAALFLAPDQSSFVTGHALVVDGGLAAQLQDGAAASVEEQVLRELTVLGGEYVSRHKQ